MSSPLRPPRRALLRGALGLGTAAALTACGGGSTTPRTSGDVTLSLWTHDPGYEAFFRTGIPEADRLTDFRYHLKVTRVAPADLVTKLLAQAVAGRGTPDLVGFEIGSFPRMLRGDIAPRLLHDLTPDRAAVPGLKDDLLCDAAVHRAVDPGLGAGGRPHRRGERVRHLPDHRAAAAAALARRARRVAVPEQRQYDLVLAGAVLAVVPAVALFVLLRKQLLEGLSTGAVKG